MIQINEIYNLKEYRKQILVKKKKKLKQDNNFEQILEEACKTWIKK